MRLRLSAYIISFNTRHYILYTIYRLYFITDTFSFWTTLVIYLIYTTRTSLILKEIYVLFKMMIIRKRNIFRICYFP